MNDAKAKARRRMEVSELLQGNKMMGKELELELLELELKLDTW